MNETRIPKIIHYCWFGNSEIPEELKTYIDSWKICNDFEIIEWNESTFEFPDNSYTRKALKENKWAFQSDYCRLKVLYEYGGIYLDTDVKLFKSFEPLLNVPLFLNYIFDCSVGTAVIGSEPKNPFIKELLDIYDRIEFSDEIPKGEIQELNGRYYMNDFIANNYLFTWLILKKYPSFKLNNKYQDLGDLIIYPKELFEIGSLLRKHYAIHYCTGTWKPSVSSNKGFKSRVKKILWQWPKIYDYFQILSRKILYHKKNKNIPFYKEHLRRKKL